MTTTKHSRDDIVTADQKMIDGIQKNKATLPASFMIRSRTMTLDNIIAMLQARIVAAKAAQASETARAAAVKADRDERKTTTADVTALKGILVRSYANSPDTLGDYGLKAPLPVHKKAAVKAAAAAKATATRKVNHPTTSKAKKGVQPPAPQPPVDNGGGSGQKPVA
jgi:hypothetical protein